MIPPESIKALQRRLGVPADGAFGPLTFGAVIGRLNELDALRAASRAVGAGVDGTLARPPAPPVAGAPFPPPDGQNKGLSDPAKFFAALRGKFGAFDQSQVEGFEYLAGKMAAAGWPAGWAAYGLATAFHETAQRMQPVREGLDVSDNWRRTHLRYYPWYGRGYPQTTWEENYRKADEKLGLGGTLIANPDRMLEPEIASATMIRGMVEGWFSGDKFGRHTLARHLPAEGPATLEQFKQARRIINLMDKADKIAREAVAIQAALEAGGWR